MKELIHTALLVNFCFLASILLPGQAIHHLWRGGGAARGESSSGRLVEVLATGFVWAMAQFFLLFGLLRPVLGLGPEGMAWIKYSSDAAWIVAGLIPRASARLGMMPELAGWFRCLMRPGNLAGIGLALITGAYSIVQFPYSSDNSALYWLAETITDPDLRLSAGEHAPAYFAWIYWPAWLRWPDVAPSTAGACSKMLLHVVTFFALKRICGLSRLTARPWIPPLLFLGVFFSFFGDYGLINSGKETVFGLVFLFAAMATLGRGREGEFVDGASAREFAALMALAIGFAATAIPYGMAFMAVFLIVARPANGVARLLLMTGWAVAVPFAFTLGTMLRQPFWIAALLYGVLLGVLFLVRSRVDAVARFWHRWAGDRGRYFDGAFVGALAVGAACLLPFEYRLCPRTPLDGETSFFDLFFISKYNSVMPPYMGFLAFGGFVAVMFSGASPGRAVLLSMIGMLFAVLAPVLILARIESFQLPFHPQKLWDLVKNVPNWCWGIWANYFALYFMAFVVDTLGRWPRLRQWSRWWPATAGWLLLAVISVHFAGLVASGRLRAIARFGAGAFLTSTGGHRVAELAIYSNAMLRTLKEFPILKPGVAVEGGSEGIGYFSELIGSGVRTRGISATPAGEWQSDVRLGPELVAEWQAKPAFLISKRTTVQTWWDLEKPAITLTELESVPDGSSLFFAGPAGNAGASLSLKEPPPFGLPESTVWRTILGQRRVNWAELEAAPLRSKNGNQYLWGKPSGTMWISCDARDHSKPVLVDIGIRMVGEKPGSLVLDSPALDRPVTFSREVKSAELALDVSRLDSSHHFYGVDWIPLEFTFHGDQRFEEGYDYPKNYTVDKLSVSGVRFID